MREIRESETTTGRAVGITIADFHFLSIMITFAFKVLQLVRGDSLA